MSTENMSLYVIGGRSGPLKIGIASDPEKRRHVIQTGSASKVSILHSLSVAKEQCPHVEGYVHWLLRERCVRGEWFKVSIDEARQAIEDAVVAVASGKRVKLSVGRKKINDEQMPARFPEGTFAKIDAVLSQGEKRSDLLREAVEREIKRRERKTSSEKFSNS